MRRAFRLLLPLTLGPLILLGWMILLQPGESVVASSAQVIRDDLHEMIEPSTVISAALEYVKTQQQPDGGVAGFGLESDPDSTARAVLALAAAGRSMSWMTSISGITMVEYLQLHAITYTHDTSGILSPGRAGILLAAASAANEDVSSFGGMDIITELEATLNPATGAYTTGEASDLSQAWAILGLSAAGMPVPIISSDYLLATQAEDGSWGYGDLDTTALVVEALLGSGNLQPHDAAIQKALDYFKANQLSNGGWRPVWDSDPLNADSTGWILQALRTAGFTYPSISWASEEGDPVSALISLQKPDGSIGGTYANAYSTVEAIYGLTEEALANLGRWSRSQHALTWLNDLQNPDGSWSLPGGQPDPVVTTDVVLAYLAAGFDAHSVKPLGGSLSAMDYLSNTASTYTSLGPDTAGKLALAVKAAGDDPSNFGNTDILQEISSTYNLEYGGYGVITNTWHQAYAILGLRAAEVSVPTDAIDTLRELQQADGGWRHDEGISQSDPKSTALAMQALIAAGDPPHSNPIQEAISFLHNNQDSHAGWSNASSTAFAIQGLLAADINLTAEDWLVEEHSPFNALVAYQKDDGPFFADHILLALDDTEATCLAIPALFNLSYPFQPQDLIPFIRSQPLADADRAVISLPRSAWSNSIVVTAPVGSDFNHNLELTLDWRVAGTEEWISNTLMQRESGYFSAFLPIDEPQLYELKLNYSDPESIQFDGILTKTLILETIVVPYQVFLPLLDG